MSEVLDSKRLRGIVGADWLPVVGGLTILYVPTFYDLARTLWQKDDFAHGPIILPVIAWLIWDRRQIMLAASTNTAAVSGLS